jgi:hypothetical protein
MFHLKNRRTFALFTNRHSPLPMSSNCTCIVVPLSRHWQTKTLSKTLTAGAVTRASWQECWQVVSQWVWNLRLEVGHRLEPAPLRTTEFAPALSPQSEQAVTRPPSSPPAAGSAPPTSATRLGKRSASAEPTFLSSLMGRCAVQQESLFTPRSGKALPMAVCAWCMRPALATAARVRGVSSASGMPARPRSRSPRECAAPSAAGGSRTIALALLPPQSAPARLSAARAAPTHRGEPIATCRRAACHSGRDPVPCAARALASLVGRRLTRNARPETAGRVTASTK